MQPGAGGGGGGKVWGEEEGERFGRRRTSMSRAVLHAAAKRVFTTDYRFKLKSKIWGVLAEKVFFGFGTLAPRNPISIFLVLSLVK